MFSGRAQAPLDGGFGVKKYLILTQIHIHRGFSQMSGMSISTPILKQSSAMLR